MGIEDRVARRYIRAKAKHFRIDKRRLKGLNDPDKNLDQMRQEGGYSKWEIELVPVRNIVVEKVWKPKRFDKALDRMQKGQLLDPINAVKKGGKWLIEDGIHRTNASIEMGYSHIPVFVSTWVKTPEAFVPPEPEKAQLREGDWVKLHKPYDGHIYGWVTEVFNPRTFQGVKRFRYALEFIDEDGEEWSFGDFLDADFEPSRPPPWGEKAKAKAL